MTQPTPLLPPLTDFAEITQLIVAARLRAVQAVNTTLIDLYWQVCQTISQKIAQAQWGDGVVAQLAAHLAHTQPGLRGFTARNLFRMRQFYEAYQGDAIVAPLAKLLPWTHNLIILNQSKRPEEREFSCGRLSVSSGASGSWSGNSKPPCSSARCSVRQK